MDPDDTEGARSERPGADEWCASEALPIIVGRPQSGRHLHVHFRRNYVAGSMTRVLPKPEPHSKERMMNEESLFVAALGKPTATERRAFLEQACAGNVALRQRVEQLLEAHEKTLGILDQSGAGPGWTLYSADPGSAAPGRDLCVGTILAGRYKLIEEIGAGGMGTVWKAEQTEPVRRIVALKLIKPGMDSRTVLARFEAERQALALMEHPNIARVLDGGTTDDGRPFFVMEYVKGVPFTQYCDEACLSIAERLELFVPVCQAIQHAHTKRVIHRDLKPSNILVCLYDGQPVPKVIDFGLAKAIQQPLTEQTLHTAHGAVLGTPLYMSPEQAEINNLDVDARADVYALGVILYELLTGTTPLERDRFHRAAWHEMLRVIKEEEPPRPSARLSGSTSLPSLAAQRRLEPIRLTKLVRGELDWIVMKCLEKDRSRRYETANGLARDVQRYLLDESVEACPPSAGYRFTKFLRRNRGPVFSAMLLLLLLVAGIIGTTIGLLRVQKAGEGERAAKEMAMKRLAQIERGVDILGSIFEDLDPRAEEREGRPLRVILGERLDRAAAELEGEAVADHMVVAKLQDRLGRTYLALGHAAKAKDLLAKAAESRRIQLGADHRDTLAVMSRLGQALWGVGQVNEAIDLLEKVRAAQIKSLGATDRETLATGTTLAEAYRTVGRVKEAVSLQEQIHSALLATLGPENDQTLDALASLAEAYVAVGKGEEATALSQQVRDIYVKKYGAGHTLAILALGDLAFNYQAVGKMRQALSLYEQARDELMPTLGAAHPRTLNILDNLVRMYRAFGRLDESIALGEKMRDAHVMISGAYHPDTIYALNNLGLAYAAAQDSEKALPLFLQAAVGLEKLKFTDGHAGRIITDLCESLEQRKQTDLADRWRRKWLAASKEKNGAESATYAQDLEDQAGALIRNGRHAEAEPILRESLAIRQKVQPDDWTTYFVRSSLGSSLLGQKKYGEAESDLLQAYEGLKARERQIPTLFAKAFLADAAGRIIRLYEAWGKTEKAAEWRAKHSRPDQHGHAP